MPKPLKPIFTSPYNEAEAANVCACALMLMKDSNRAILGANMALSITKLSKRVGSEMVVDVPRVVELHQSVVDVYFGV